MERITREIHVAKSNPHEPEAMQILSEIEPTGGNGSGGSGA